MACALSSAGLYLTLDLTPGVYHGAINLAHQRRVDALSLRAQVCCSPDRLVWLAPYETLRLRDLCQERVPCPTGMMLEHLESLA